MGILLGYVASLGMAAGSLAWWRQIVPFYMRLLHGDNRRQDKVAPHGVTINRYFGTVFLALIAIAVFVSSAAGLVRSIM